MDQLNQLKQTIIANGCIDEQTVKQLKKLLYASGKIEKEDGDVLFELNNAVSGKPNHASWQVLFVDAITECLLEDSTSPGEIDEKETKWLLPKLKPQREQDANEKALIFSLKNKAQKYPKILDF